MCDGTVVRVQRHSFSLLFTVYLVVHSLFGPLHFYAKEAQGYVIAGSWECKFYRVTQETRAPRKDARSGSTSQRSWCLLVAYYRLHWYRRFAPRYFSSFLVVSLDVVAEDSVYILRYTQGRYFRRESSLFMLLGA